MIRFSGICVGGPLDGNQLVHTRPHYEVVEPPEQVPMFDLDRMNGVVSASDPMGTRHTYIHVVGLTSDRFAAIDFWVHRKPKEHLSVSSRQALTMFVNNYAKMAGRLRLLKQCGILDQEEEVVHAQIEQTRESLRADQAASAQKTEAQEGQGSAQDETAA